MTSTDTNKPRRRFFSPLDMHQGRVDLSHGGGGRAMAQLIAEVFHYHLNNDLLRQGNDQALFGPLRGRLVMSTDGHVVAPLFFNGGNIGSLAVHGTINDVAMAGARPLYLAAGFILEEGLPLADLERIVISMAEACKTAGVPIVTGDTKVVERGKADGCFITTTGVGEVPEGINISGERATPGDAVLVSGTLGDHGIAILSQRENLGFGTDICSDSAALHDLVAAMVEAVPEIHCLRDPTRGGLAATLNELAAQAGVGMQLREAEIPVKAGVRAACEFLGLDPLHIANEGKLIAICPASAAERLVNTMRQHPLGREAAIIGEVVKDPQQLIELETPFGGRRLLDWLTGEQLPRIC
ncbi:hydrogenase expression/formation protein HypE [Rhabdochromatium marinum]|uniref:hydrogenase expression/formation protein HypE n=1 Tax=Rhabdochromatium marinum TaxID=48729 RepID=UPI0019042498|nr:hydrogenase expression/formation protein HypE [Rhabdochromatium marinum]MBK1648608.1 hydrogenase expression/formation protein HypE [Rhabdochromatium marinum]